MSNIIQGFLSIQTNIDTDKEIFWFVIQTQNVFIDIFSLAFLNILAVALSWPLMNTFINIYSVILSVTKKKDSWVKPELKKIITGQLMLFLLRQNFKITTTFVQVSYLLFFRPHPIVLRDMHKYPWHTWEYLCKQKSEK